MSSGKYHGYFLKEVFKKFLKTFFFFDLSVTTSDETFVISKVTLDKHLQGSLK